MRVEFPVASKTVAASIAFVLFAALACSEGATPIGTPDGDGQPSPPPAAEAAGSSGPMSDHEKTLYAVGGMSGRAISRFGLTDEEIPLVIRGFEDASLSREMAVDPDAYQKAISDLYNSRSAAASAEELAAAETFVAEQAALEGAVQSASGVIMTEVAAGTDEKPALTDTVEVHYHGTLRDGTVFDSSVERGSPARFPVNGVIPCWQEAIPKLGVGAKARIVCPPATAYGNRATGKIPAGAALVFDVELISVNPTP